MAGGPMPLLPRPLREYLNLGLNPRRDDYIALSPDLDAHGRSEGLSIEDELAPGGRRESTATPSNWGAPSRGANSRLVLILSSILALSLLVIIALAIRVARTSPKPEPPPQLLIRTVEDNGAGIGSVIQQLQRSVVMAGAMGAEIFAVGESQSFSSIGSKGGGRHGYDTVGIINSRRITLFENLDLKRVCKVSRYFSQDDYKRVTDDACNASLNNQPLSTALSEWQLWRLSMMETCSVVLQDQPWEFDPQLVKCTWKWVSRLFEHPLPRVVPQKTSVALHVRWYDMAGDDMPGDTRTADRSIPIDTANAVVAGLTTCLGPLSVTVYMENSDTKVLSRLTHPFELVDTGSDLNDLLDMTRNEVLIIAGSGFTVASHQMARGGLSLVPDWEGHQHRYWEETGTNEVLQWQDLADDAKRDCAVVKEKYEKGRERSRAATREFGETTWKEIGVGR